MNQYHPNDSYTQAPSPSPLPSNSPVLNLPQDGIDALSVSTITQAFKSLGDFTSYTQNILNGQPAFSPGSTGSGYTVVVHTGTGPSNGCVPSSPATASVAQPTYAPYNYFVTITTGGGVGTSRFKISYDGGVNTAVSGIATTSSYTDGYGTNLVFSGTLVLNDTYQFRPVDVPILKTVTNMGKYTLDHLGYPLGSNLMSLSENWVGAATGVLTNGTITGFGKWSCSAIGTNANIQSVQPFAPHCVPSLSLNSGNQSTSHADAYSSVQVCYVNTPNLIAVVECDAYLTMPISKSWIFYFGFMGNPATGPLTTDYNAAFQIQSTGASASIRAFTQNSTSNTGFTSPQTYTANSVYRLRVELHSINSIFGGCARFFCNNSLMAVSTSNLPINVNQLLYVGAILQSHDTNSSTTAYLTTINCIVDNLTPAVGV